jgi:heterodisulfide reductase subunit C
MSLDVVSELKNGSIKNLECIQCGACAAGCPKKVLKYDFSAEK